MSTAQVRLDLRSAKNALFVRQTVALAFGIPLDREFTWGILGRLICRPDNGELPERVVVEGLPALHSRVPHEARMLAKFFDSLCAARPGIEVVIRLH
jgi:hypothetical protein